MSDATPSPEAVDALRSGGLVGLPTETVYGLAADATDPAAVARIFAAKGRPADNPLIVHVADEPAAAALAREWPATARTLARAFWPGPLTIVVPATDAVAPAVTAGTGNVGLRVPNHPAALALLREAGVPVAAPSANRSEHVSPTTAEHVRAAFPDVVVVDGGPCRVGVESTVVRCHADHAVVLRPGGVTPAMIEAAGVEVREADAPPSASPGRRPRHYAPASPAYRFDPADPPVGGGEEATVMCLTLEPIGKGWHRMPADPAMYARYLYAVLRKLDAERPDAIHIEMPPDEPQWATVRDRLTRATVPR